MTASLARTDANTLRRGACPSIATPMQTGDGLLVRLRPAAPALSAGDLAAIATLARDHGNGLIEITARGNLQLRGLTEASVPRLAAGLQAAGIVPQAGVAIESRSDRAAGDGAHHQPAAGAGIAEIERRGGLGKPRDPDALHPPIARADAFHARPKRAHRLAGIEHVLAFQQPADTGFAHSQGPEDQGPVRNRLVARDAQAAPQGAAPTCSEGLNGGGSHGR